MKRLWTIIGVDDVARSTAWYQQLLGLPQAPPAHDYFGQLADADGEVLVSLHAWGDHDHPPLIGPQPGKDNGLILFFRIDDFDAAFARAHELVGERGGELAEEPHRNPGTGTLEFALHDPDGYYVMISSLSP